MAGRLGFKVFNGPFPTTAAQAPVTTGTAIKTMLQLKPITQLTVVSWGISFDASALATPIRCELLTTGTVFATVTATVEADITRFYDGPANSVTAATYLTLGTAATGYTSTAEGTITATDMIDARFVSPTDGWNYEWSLGREPVVQAGDCLRIRVTAAAAVNAYCWVLLET